MPEPANPKINDTWSEAEQWVWKEIIAGRKADFNKKYENILSPKKAKGWDTSTADRIISQEFLEEILTNEKLTSKVNTKGIRIFGAFFKEALDLSDQKLGFPFWLNKCRFLESLDFSSIKVNGWFSLEDSYLAKNLNMGWAVLESVNLRTNIQGKVHLHSAHILGDLSMPNGLFSGAINLATTVIRGQVNMIGAKFMDSLDMNSMEVGKDLFMGEKTRFKDVKLAYATVGGLLDLTESTIEGNLGMDSIRVGRDLDMSDGASFKKVTITSASIGRNINMGASKFDEKLDMNSMEIGGNLMMSPNAKFNKVDLIAAKIRGQVNMCGSLFSGTLGMNEIEVGQRLFMSENAKFKEIKLDFSKIGGGLDMGNSIFDKGLSMSSIEVGGDLLMSPNAKFNMVELYGAKISGQVNMIGSLFNGTLGMNEIEIDQSLFMSENAKFNKVELFAAKIRGQVDMGNSIFHEELNMSSIIVGQDLYLNEKASFKLIRLVNSRIGRNIDMSYSSFKGGLYEDLFESYTEANTDSEPVFKSVDLSAAKIDGQIGINKSSFQHELNLHAVEIGMHLILQGGTSFQNCDLTFSNIGGHLQIRDCRFDKELNCGLLRVGRDTLIENVETSDISFNSGTVNGNFQIDTLDTFNKFSPEGLIYKPLSLDCASISVGSDIQINNADLFEISFNSASVNGNFQIDNIYTSNKFSPEELIYKPILDCASISVGSDFLIKNSDFSEIYFNGATINEKLKIDRPDTSNRLSLEGLTYKSISIDNINTSTKQKKINSERWLGMDENYHPQPYEFLARYNNSIGYHTVASKIRYLSKEKRRKTAWSHNEYRTWIGLTLSKLFIGYGLGYGYFWAVVWFIGLCFLGCFVFLNFGNNMNVEFSKVFWASFDNALPLVTLNTGNEDLIFESQGNAVAVFFYFQKLFGFVLGGFLVAGLSGLTQKS